MGIRFREEGDMKRILFLAMAAALVLMPALASAQSGMTKLPAFKEYDLKNGLKVFIMETREVPLVTMRLCVPAGSAMDDPAREGIANLTGRLLQKGAGGLTEDQISGMIEDVGGRINVYTGRDYSIVNGDFLAKDLSRGLDLMGKIVISPDFPKPEFEREKGLVTAEIQAAREQPMGVASKEFVRVLLGDHPYAHPVDGTEGSVTGLTREAVVEFHKKHYVSGGSVIAVVGDVNAATALELVKKTFDGWKGAAPADMATPRLATKKYPGRKLIVINKPDVTQSQIRIGNVAVGRNTPEYFPLLVTNNVLGGGFTSRLMDEIRVNRGLSYGARSGLTQLKAGGYFTVMTYTKNKTLRETIDVALEQLKKIRDEKMSDTELTSSKQYLSGLFPFDIETNGDLASWLVDLSFYKLPLDYVEGYREHVDKVTPGEAMKVADEHFWVDDNLILLLAPYDQVKDQLTGLGEVEVVDFDHVK
jgi:zinc protease